MKNEEMKKELEKNITKQSKRILLVLYYMKKAYSSTLAEYFEIKRNAMSNRLERLKNLPQELITVKKTGRRMEYSLTDLGVEYVRECLDNEQTRAELFGKGWSYIPESEQQSNEESLIKEGLNILWDLDLDTEEWKRAYMAIDILFDGESRDFAITENMIEALYKIGFSRKEAREMSFAMMNVVTKAQKSELSKEEFCESLVDEGADDERFVYYIAEKYISKYSF